MEPSEDAPRTQNKSHNSLPSQTPASAAIAAQRAPAAGSSGNTRPARTHLRGGFCEPDPLDPDRVPCDAKVEHEDRQGISHFFGRNKRATSTIPTTCYPLLCRNHYQERKYRMRETLWIEAGQQCDAIAITMKRMSELTWTDSKGLVWPRWSAFELQLCHAPAEDKEDGDEDADEEDGTPPPNPKKKRKTATQFTADTKTQPGDDAKPIRKQRVKPNPAPVPEWLQKLCSVEDANQTGKFSHIGERGGARYSFDDMAKIVRHIKSYCLREKCRLPAVEALPVTAGLQAEVDIKVAKIHLEDRNKEYNRARHELYQAQENDRDMRGPQSIVMMKQVELNAAKQKLKSAKEMLAWCKETLPERRVPKKRGDKRESATPGVDGDDGKVEHAENDAKMEIDEDGIDGIPAPRQRGRLRRGGDRTATEAANQQAADAMEIDIDDNEAPPPRIRGRKLPPTKKGILLTRGQQGLSDDNDDDEFPPRRRQRPRREPRPADNDTKPAVGTSDLSPQSAKIATPTSMNRLLLVNKKKSTPISSPSTPRKPPAAGSAPTPTSGQRAAALRPLRARFNWIPKPRTPMPRGTAAAIEDEGDDDVIVTGVVATPLGKRKRPLPKLAPGVAPESDTDGDIDVGY